MNTIDQIRKLIKQGEILTGSKPNQITVGENVARCIMRDLSMEGEDIRGLESLKLHGIPVHVAAMSNTNAIELSYS